MSTRTKPSILLCHGMLADGSTRIALEVQLQCCLNVPGQIVLRGDLSKVAELNC
jgi:hypothetical protein